MARSLSTPPFPDTPGAWLACNRYRKLGPHGEHLSPEQLGSLLGVSGATVRRWEAETSEPTEQDLQRFVEVCDLTPIEAEFLQLAFNAKSHEAPPSRSMFEAAATEMLATSTPSLLVDSFLYVRAQNRAATALADMLHLAKLGDNLLRAVLEQQCSGPPHCAADEGYIERLLYDVWISTAELCGSVAYRRFLADMCLIPGFERRWRSLASQPMHESQAARMRTLPLYVIAPEIGTFRVRQTRITFPPSYELCEYIAVDAGAAEILREQTRACQVILSPQRHWACEAIDRVTPD